MNILAVVHHKELEEIHIDRLITEQEQDIIFKFNLCDKIPKELNKIKDVNILLKQTIAPKKNSIDKTLDYKNYLAKAKAKYSL